MTDWMSDELATIEAADELWIASLRHARDVTFVDADEDIDDA